MKMKQTRRAWPLAVSVIVGFLLGTSCAEDDACPEGQQCMSIAEEYCPVEGQACQAPCPDKTCPDDSEPICADECPECKTCPDDSEPICVDECPVPTPKNYAMSASFGHIHIWREKAVQFVVRNLDDCTNPEDITTCAGVSGVSPFIAYRHEDDESSKIAPSAEITDNGDGTYTWTRHFAELGAYSALFSFVEEGVEYRETFAFETSKAGGERIFRPSETDAQYSYQVRWNSDPGHIHADGDEVTFDIELMRSFGTVDTERPWTNTFNHLWSDHLTALPTITIEHDEAVVKGPLTPEYKGKGIYRVTTSFVEADLGGAEEKHFMLHVVFTDDLGYNIDETGEDYEFHVAAEH